MMSKLTLEGIDLKPLRNCHDEILASRIVRKEAGVTVSWVSRYIPDAGQAFVD